MRTDKSQKELAIEIHKNAVEKGFWSKPVSLVTRLMLVITELAEAVEADRAGKWMNHDLDLTTFDFQTFVDEIHGTVEEEIADAIIRMHDTMEGHGWSPEFCWSLVRREDETFSESVYFQVMGLTHYVYEREAKMCLESLYQMADHYSMRIDEVIRWKMEYNKTRAHMHGKGY